MLRLLLVLVLLAGLSCSKDSPPTAPAGKKTCDFCDLFDAFQDQSDGDTASDSTSSSSSDSTSSSSPDTSSSSGSVSSPTAAVVIPDAALRRYIEKVLKKNRGATITQADMKTLVNLLDGHGLGIKSLIGLEAATNLQNVAMGWNAISDLTPLLNLPKLRYLYIKGNPLSDAFLDEIRALERRGVVVSPSYLSPSDAVLIPDVALRVSIELALKKEPKQPISQAEMETLTSFAVAGPEVKSLIGLETATNLQTLDLNNNVISDVTPLAHLVKLQTLHLNNNVISDVTPLAHLVKLQTLHLNNNAISDLTPLANLDRLRQLDVRANFLSEASIKEHIPALQRRGVEVQFYPGFHLPIDREGPFDIELVFLGYFTGQEQDILRRAANRWEAAIQADIPDYTFSKPTLAGCGIVNDFFTIPAGDHIDDLRIYVAKYSAGGLAPVGTASLQLVRSSALPIMSCVQLNEQQLSNRPYELWSTGLHEIGHSLGIGTSWDYKESDQYNSVGGNGWKDSGMLRDLYSADAHFAGPQAIAAFDQAGGTNYQGAKVPTQQNGTHWRSSVISSELMSISGGSFLSAITLGALSDLGYSVDFSMADPYELPPLGAAKPVADAVPFCSLEGLPAPVYVDD